LSSRGALKTLRKTAFPPSRRRTQHCRRGGLSAPEAAAPFDGTLEPGATAAPPQQTRATVPTLRRQQAECSALQEALHRLLQQRRQLDDGVGVGVSELSAGVERCSREALAIHQLLRRQLGCPSLRLSAGWPATAS